MGRLAKENKRFMNTPPPRREVGEFVKRYHKERITPEIDATFQSAVRIILMLLTETGVMPKDKLDEFMNKVHDMAKLESQVASETSSE